MKLVKIIAPQPPNAVLESCEYKKPLNKNSSANGAIITTEIKPKMIGSDNMKVMKPSDICISRSII